MADPRVSACGDQPRLTDHDHVQQAALAILLDAHPAQLSVDELVRELTDRPDEFGPRDAIDNALRDLVGAGLVHRHGTFVFPTRAAVRFDELQT
jgi:Fe2+ or Zn2+ uptake regulation protein